MKMIVKDDIVAEIERRIKALHSTLNERETAVKFELKDLLSFLNTLEVKDHYEQYVQYDSIKAGIQAHAETYSFNIESELFNQLTKEQQKLLRKEIEQACISGGEAGVELARNIRYKENVEVKKMDLEKEFNNFLDSFEGVPRMWHSNEQMEWGKDIAKHFFEFGVKTRKEEVK